MSDELNDVIADLVAEAGTEGGSGHIQIKEFDDDPWVGKSWAFCFGALIVSYKHLKMQAHDYQVTVLNKSYTDHAMINPNQALDHYRSIGFAHCDTLNRYNKSRRIPNRISTLYQLVFEKLGSHKLPDFLSLEEKNAFGDGYYMMDDVEHRFWKRLKEHREKNPKPTNPKPLKNGHKKNHQNGKDSETVSEEVV